MCQTVNQNVYNYELHMDEDELTSLIVVLRAYNRLVKEHGTEEDYVGSSLANQVLKSLEELHKTISYENYNIATKR